jgi:hypothetical protein
MLVHNSNTDRFFLKSFEGGRLDNSHLLATPRATTLHHRKPGKATHSDKKKQGKGEKQTLHCEKT